MVILSDGPLVENPNLDPNNLTQPENAFYPLFENQLEVLTREVQAAVEESVEKESKTASKVSFPLL